MAMTSFFNSNTRTFENSYVRILTNLAQYRDLFGAIIDEGALAAAL